MMSQSRSVAERVSCSRSIAAVACMLFAFFAISFAAADDDPSGRVARLSDSRGDVSYSPGGEDEWVNAVRNRPLIPGDRLWTDRRARAELQVGGATLHLDEQTSFEILRLDDSNVQVQVTQGTVSLRVRRLIAGQSYEIDTPTLAFVIDQAGRYRIDVGPDGRATTVVVWQGSCAAYGDNANFPLRAGDVARFDSADLRDYQLFDLPRPDGFDRYSDDRDARLERSLSLRYVDDDVIGYSDLDDYGNWRPVATYGSVWFPTRVRAGWAPYRDGHWVWQEPWSWTWVDDEPWGFAPSHYGRWVSVNNRWGWIPGPRHQRAVYAPALVGFVGGRNWSISVTGGGSSIGWFPLGPREVYVPPYRSSRNYFTRVNINNTTVNNVAVTSSYNNYAQRNGNFTRINYASRSIPGAMTAVPSTVFVNAQPVRQGAILMNRNAVAGGDITRGAALAPSARSVLGAARPTNARPSGDVFERRVIARTAPPVRIQAFTQREQELQRNPGQPPERRPNGERPRAEQRVADPLVHVVGAQPGAINVREAVPEPADRHGNGNGNNGRGKPPERASDAAQSPTGRQSAADQAQHRISEARDHSTAQQQMEAKQQAGARQQADLKK